MKIPLVYGALIALVGALLQYGLFFAGFYDTPEKLQSAQWIATVIGTVATIICLALAMRDRRTQAPVSQPWTYGNAVVAGVLAGLVAAFAGTILSYIYFAYVNPQMSEVIYQANVAKLEAKGMNSSEIEAAASTMRKFLSPGIMALFQLIGAIFWASVLSLIIAIFFRKREPSGLPPESEAPPPLA